MRKEQKELNYIMKLQQLLCLLLFPGDLGHFLILSRICHPLSAGHNFLTHPGPVRILAFL